MTDVRGTSSASSEGIITSSSDLNSILRATSTYPDDDAELPYLQPDQPSLSENAPFCVIDLVRDQLNARESKLEGGFDLTDPAVLRRALALGDKVLTECRSVPNAASLLHSVLLEIQVSVPDPARIERLALHTDARSADYIRSVARHGLDLQ